MKKNKKIIIIVIAVISVIIIGLSVSNIFRDSNRLTAKEKKWLKNNQEELIDVRVLNDVATFGLSGEGVFYDYLNDFKNKYKLDINVIPYAYGAISPGISFKVSNTVSPKDVVFYKDHFVVVSKETQIINNLSDLDGKKVGVLNTDLSYISYYFSNDQLTFEQFNSLTSLMESLDSLDHVIVPLNQSLELILDNSYVINYHLSDIIQYYYLSFEEESIISGIMQKHYDLWSKDDLDKSYYNNLLPIYVKGLNLSEADMHTLTSKVYNYGVVETAPYEILANNKYGGIVSEYINSFIKMSEIDFKFNKYKSYNLLNRAANSKKIDLYFSNIELANKFTNINTGMDIEYDVITKNTNAVVVNSLESLKGKTVYILKDSNLYSYFQNLNIVTIKTYKTQKELFNLLKSKDNIVIVDAIVFDYFNNVKIKNVVSKYQSEAENIDFSFKSNASETFNLLFSSFVRSVDNNVIKDTGINSYNKNLDSSTLIGTIFKYFSYIILGGAIIAFIIYHYTKKIKISNRIKKEDKIRFIDQMTSLKNRNFLNENLSKWNQNNIYPQATIIVDLNNVKYINDTYGHGEGDRQIRAAANILIKTQLDNSEIIRTDGNEFLIYMIEYPEKQVSGYIHKLNKEFNKLPYEYGAAFGYSMIENDLKLVDDAINEATIDMRTNKKNGASNVEKI